MSEKAMPSEDFDGQLFKNASFNFLKISYWYVGIPLAKEGLRTLLR